mgnify:CR=1 FL=1
MTDAQKQACDFVRYVLEQICELKDKINVEPRAEEHETIIMAQVDESEMGRAIGKEGQTISALRTLVKIVGARGEERLHLKVEPLV